MSGGTGYGQLIYNNSNEAEHVRLRFLDGQLTGYEVEG